MTARRWPPPPPWLLPGPSIPGLWLSAPRCTCAASHSAWSRCIPALDWLSLRRIGYGASWVYMAVSTVGYWVLQVTVLLFVRAGSKDGGRAVDGCCVLQMQRVMALTGWRATWLESSAFVSVCVAACGTADDNQWPAGRSGRGYRRGKDEACARGLLMMGDAGDAFVVVCRRKGEEALQWRLLCPPVYAYPLVVVRYLLQVLLLFRVLYFGAALGPGRCSFG